MRWWAWCPCVVSKEVLTDCSTLEEARTLTRDLALRDIAAADVEVAVLRGWWPLVQDWVSASHTDPAADFGYPVRRATKAVKSNADLLLKWLDPTFAIPKEVQAATQWAQNSSHVFLRTRFTNKWSLPGATFMRYDGLRAKVVPIAPNVTVSISGAAVSLRSSEAEVSNRRYFYVVSFTPFDRIDPTQSAWQLEEQKAQGSMQMSLGARIHEVWVTLQKAAPGLRWGRLTASAPDPEHFGRWVGHESEFSSDGDFDQKAALMVSPLSCLEASRYHCAQLDSCVADCGSCSPGSSAVEGVCSGSVST
mmetsp:Transcript_84693/g.193132  ORF Transcript_84693/g.193132 Transcript_84693/m.193132 type:complete len:306 (+) Transcript_84693:21-938(+)